jgi:hypothetical protein
MPELLTTEVKKTIRKPLAVVAGQFGDIPHHVKRGVHHGIHYTVRSVDGETCRYEQRVRILGMMQVDENVIARQPDGSVVQETLSGTNVGMKISSFFRELGADATEVTVRVDVPKVGIKKLLAPLFNAAVRKTTEKALEEDREDIEVNGYPG